jgi:hypothetical protein
MEIFCTRQLNEAPRWNCISDNLIYGVLVQMEIVKGQQTFVLLKKLERSTKGCSLGVMP